jgi:phospholipase C
MRALHRSFLAVAIAGTVVACSSPALGPVPTNFLPRLRGASGSSKIQHVVVIVQENRSFDNFFATFPGADGTTVGKAEAIPASDDCPIPVPSATTIPLTEVNLLGQGFGSGFSAQQGADLNHLYSGFQTEWDHGGMDGFSVEQLGASGGAGPACTYPYQYVNPSDIKPYWDMAKQYVLADHTFQDQGSSSFTAHQDLIAGGTVIDSNEALIDNPSYFPWGCDARTPNPTASPKVNGVVTGVIRRDGKVFEYGGPFPCLGYTTLRDSLDAKSVSWKYYAVAVANWKHCPKCEDSGIWSAFDAVKAVRYSSEWKNNVTRSPNVFFHDVSTHQLPAVSWVTPNGPNSDHPGSLSDTGPSWVASVVNAIGQSDYWKSTAIVIVWDDWGGMFDHVAPPEPRSWTGGPGFRVPMLIVSPYVKPHVQHTEYEFGSILHFVEDNWDLQTLGRNDAKAVSIGNAFDFTMSPRKFVKIGAKYSRSFFLRQKPSNEPPDTE